MIFDSAKRAEICSNVQVIINNAASIDFNLRLDHAIKINYYGALGLLKIAHDCPRIEVYTHVSTAYVNCEKR